MAKTANEKLVLQGGASIPSLPSKAVLGTDASGNIITGSSSGAAGATGIATLDFGTYPGVASTSVAVTGQTAIVGGSVPEAALVPAATVDHSVDEHVVESLEIVAGNVVAGTGFTIYGHNSASGGRIYGKWNVGWKWS